MISEGHLDATKGEVPATARIHRMNLFAAILLGILCNFKIADNGCACALDNGLGVAVVIAVSVGEQDVISGDLIRLDGGEVVACKEGIDQKMSTLGFNRDASVTVKGNLHRKASMIGRRRRAPVGLGAFCIPQNVGDEDRLCGGAFADAAAS